MTTPTSTKLRAQAYADEALGATGQALEHTRDYANTVLERAGEKVRDLRYGARDIASRSASTMSEATAAAQRQLGTYANATGRYVSQQPVKSALIAAAVGAAVAALVLAWRRNREY